MNKTINIKIMNENEKNFILENYSILGGIGCAEILGISRNSIYIFASKNKLKINENVLKKIASKRSKENWKNHEYKDSDYKVSSNFFKKCETPESAYILGLLWADGTIYKKNYHNKISIECLESDMINWLDIFKKSGEWTFYIRKGRISGKNMMTLSTNNKDLINFLIDNNYDIKSTASPDKILSKIPIELQHYFFRGWIDGDGCFYFNKKNNARQFYLSGAFNQDWNASEILFKSIDVKYSICRIENKNSYSCIRVTNKNGIEKIGNFVYKNFKNDCIGLNRKYEKLQEIIS